MEQFTAVIKQVEGKDASYIEIPYDVEKVHGKKRVKVKATFDGYEYQGSIVKMGLPCYMIGMTKAIRNAIGKTFGDKVTVTIEEDKEERKVEVPEELREAFLNEIEAKTFYEGLSYSMQKKYADWISSAKREETKIKRVAEAILKLKNKEKI